MKKFVGQKRLLPAFPRTPLLPYQPNATVDDIIASNADIKLLFDENSRVSIEEKIDAASVGMVLRFEGTVGDDSHPVIRNRDHILRKGYMKDTPAKKQFVSIWTWFYENKDKFGKLRDKGPYSVYGEWMVARHGIYYDRLPDWFIAYDLYNYETGQFLQTPKTRAILLECGFQIPCLLSNEPLQSIEMVTQWDHTVCEWSHEKIEGVYFKIWNEEIITNRFKWVRPSFERGKYWDGKTLRKNKLHKEKK
jgi:atypical dual specificity phosphatase